MSTPRTLTLPDGVEATRIETPVGTFAAHVARTDSPTAHVLLIPGWTGSKEDFTPLLPLLAAAGYDATAYDQRGQFESPGGADADYTLDGFAADALAVASACSDEPPHLLGHSFGGLVAQQAVLAIDVGLAQPEPARHRPRRPRRHADPAPDDALRGHRCHADGRHPSDPGGGDGRQARA